MIYLFICSCLPEQPLTPCQQQQVDFFSSPPSRRKYLPRCGTSGEYLEIQCSVQSDECWCVTENGTEIPQTRTSGPIRCPKPGTTILGLSLFLPVKVFCANYFVHPLSVHTINVTMSGHIKYCLHALRKKCKQM